MAILAFTGCTPDEQAAFDAFVASQQSVWTSSDPTIEQWHTTAIAAGWPETEWRWLACVIRRESGGDPTAFNGRGRDWSLGLTQLNMRSLGRWVAPIIGTQFDLLFDGPTNLAVAHALWETSGRTPWRTKRRTC